MTPDRWTRLSDWHNAWLAADDEERERLRSQLAVSDPELLTEAEELAAVSTDLPGFLETPAFVLAAPELATDDPLLEPNTMVGPYRIVALLARGGMGDVYHATDVRLRRDVALKVLSPDSTGDTRPVERFVQEARFTASLDHPNIVRLYDIGLVGGRPYFVEELLDGETLRACIGRGALAVPDVLRIGADVARGLGAAHASGFVHRDLKPENIFLTRSGTTKILDFGIATLAHDETQRDGRSTLSGHLLGTAGYLAPEQIRGHEIDGRADLFTLGAILYEMLSGRRAFGRDHTVDTLHAILHEAPAEVLELRHDVPPALSALVRRLLERAPDARPRSAADVGAALDEIAGAGSQPELPLLSGMTSRHSPRIARPAIALAAMAIVLAAAVGWVNRREAASAPPRTASTLAILPFRSLPDSTDDHCSSSVLPMPSSAA
jgi:serine/threonine protein kinase